MQFKNPFIDNLSKVMADAFGAAHSAKNEAENVFKTWLDGWLADRDFVTREEFEALKLSVEELRNKSKLSVKRKKNLESWNLQDIVHMRLKRLIIVEIYKFCGYTDRKKGAVTLWHEQSQLYF